MASASDVFPPSPFDIAAARYAEHRAWYTGDMVALQAIYSGGAQQPTTHLRDGVAYRGGVIGNLSKMFWGQPIIPEEHRVRLHLPLPADVARKSSSQLFGESAKIHLPDFATTNKAGQARLDTIVNSDEAHAEWLVSGEYASSLGGTYLAPVWDTDVADNVFFKAYRADVAIPQFRYGRLVTVQLWTEYCRDDEVYRLIEAHNPGLITYTLYRGGRTNLGPAVPVTELQETAHYADLVSPVDYLPLSTEPQYRVSVATGIPDMAVSYYPNLMPQMDWENLGPLASLGRSDFLQLEPVFDKVDEMWSSLFRDVENGQGRLTIGESLLETGGPGKGTTFDPYRSVYSPVKSLGGPSDPLSSQIFLSQFDIRDGTHLNVIDALERRVLRTIGMSPKEFGKDDPTGGVKTATEVNDDRTETEATRDVKAIYARPAIARTARICLAIDGIVFPGKGGGEFDNPTVEFAQISQEDPQKRAQTLLLLDQARSISTEARVRYRLLGDDMTEPEIMAEIDRVKAEEAGPEPMIPPDFGPIGTDDGNPTA